MTRFVPDITDVLLAARFLDGKIRKTPCEMSPALEERTGRQVALKWENQQICASFKVRGALNKMFSLNEKEKEA
ncbi:MAG: threonine/serine dehydratase, partial [Synergistota bacterium]|nr:threonine/serine dehydratase [Synergistota bacterium]